MGKRPGGAIYVAELIWKMKHVPHFCKKTCFDFKMSKSRTLTRVSLTIDSWPSLFWWKHFKAIHRCSAKFPVLCLVLMFVLTDFNLLLSYMLCLVTHAFLLQWRGGGERNWYSLGIFCAFFDNTQTPRINV